MEKNVVKLMTASIEISDIGDGIGVIHIIKRGNAMSITIDQDDAAELIEAFKIFTKNVGTDEPNRQ